VRCHRNLSENRPQGNTFPSKVFEEFRIERSDRDWVVASSNGEIFEAFGGPTNLNEMIEIFLNWVEPLPQEGTRNSC